MKLPLHGHPDNDCAGLHPTGHGCGCGWLDARRRAEGLPDVAADEAARREAWRADGVRMIPCAEAHPGSPARCDGEHWSQ